MKNTSLYRGATYLIALLLSIALLTTAPKPSSAQELSDADQTNSAGSMIGLDEPASKEAVREMISALSDDAVRALLIERLDAVAEANAADASEDIGIVALTQRIAVDFYTKVRKAIFSFPEIFTTLSKARSAPVSYTHLTLPTICSV